MVRVCGDVLGWKIYTDSFGWDDEYSTRAEAEEELRRARRGNPVRQFQLVAIVKIRERE